MDRFDYQELQDMNDAEDHSVARRIIVRRSKTIRERTVFSNYDEKDFRDRFRLTKEVAWAVLAKIKDKLEHKTKWNSALTAETMLLVTLRFYATGSFLQTVGDLCGVSTKTTSRVVTVVSHNLALLAKDIICFPSDEELRSIQKQFYMTAKFPRVIAAMDCTHIKISSPGGDEAELYRNRKGWFSFNVQTLCDSTLKILDIVARWPGSAHDATIFRNSRICARLKNGEFQNGIVVADSGYQNTNWVLTPLSQCNSPEENLYNESLVRTRNCVERSYGVWKRRFPVLSLGLRINIAKVESIVVATAVLHNICCLNRDWEPPPLSPGVEDMIRSSLEFPAYNHLPSISRNNHMRLTLIDQHFSNLL
ncbi:putative nuclease HARBI1 [Eurosta solidaginis]|uniref:putative nuclease HARBI1 n=1 Tax=Eurosta solidaginis TaxID=178769 RepID=UPI003530712B